MAIVVLIMVISTVHYYHCRRHSFSSNISVRPIATQRNRTEIVLQQKLVQEAVLLLILLLLYHQMD